VPVDTDAEVFRLRALLRDLVALSAIPGGWIGRDPRDVAARMADTLVGLLQLDFGFVRLCDPGRSDAVEVTRGDAWRGFPEWLEGHLGAGAPFPAKEIVPDVGGGPEPCGGIAIPIGVNGEGGIVAAACERGDFPNESDQLLLSLAANHAATSFQSARLIFDRTAELLRSEAYLAQLVDEQAALRRVATLVAEDPSSADVFAKVAEEVANAIGGVDCALAKAEGDRTITTLAASGRGPLAALPTNERFEVEGTSIVARVLRDGRPLRIDDYATATGAIADRGRQYGIRSAAGCPIVVHGKIWGVVAVARYDDERLPPETEARVARFTELVATAIANADARAEIERLAEEQAALRRVATLVAEGDARRVAVFEAVAAEMERQLGADGVTLSRYERNDEVTVVADCGLDPRKVPSGARVSHQGENVISRVRRTERPARTEHSPGAQRAVAELGHARGVCTSVGTPIVVDGRLWGIAVGTWKGESPPADTEERMARFGHLLETAIANAETRSELIASRARLVAASDEARRRFERDLHDGVQQRLVGLALKLRNAEAIVSAGEPIATELADLGEGLNGVLEDLRELSRGIHPAILAQGGLDSAIRGLARRSGIPVLLDLDVDVRVAEPVEVAAYYVVAEALANAAKHAKASRAEVTIKSREGVLEMSIQDDGVGGAHRVHGSGLAGLGDRVEAIGGTITIKSPVGGGTSLHVSFPTPSG
jgi:signal transduction histidine kinase